MFDWWVKIIMFFFFQGLKGERGSPGTAGQKGDSVRMHSLNNVKLPVSRSSIFNGI